MSRHDKMPRVRTSQGWCFNCGEPRAKPTSECIREGWRYDLRRPGSLSLRMLCPKCIEGSSDLAVGIRMVCSKVPPETRRGARQRWWRDHERAADLAGPEAMTVYYFADMGVIVRRKQGWFAANDIRWTLVGVVPNAELTQPTTGPHQTREAAAAALGLEYPA